MEAQTSYKLILRKGHIRDEEPGQSNSNKQMEDCCQVARTWDVSRFLMPFYRTQ